jgi:aspartyl-tRNA(Asn)/glutamyl-tRNA(Gln) amidotransferase subunit A
VIVAKTNMTEFALGAIGANPHFGTPANPRDRVRVPGGSSSGAAVTVGDHMAEIAIGSDTGGSVRIPAALCGIVGFKPSRARVPTAGAFPLSTSLDSIGPLANSVADCAKADAVMAGEEFAPLEPLPVAGLRCGIAQGFPLEHLDETVAAAFDAATERLAKAGVRLTREAMPLFDEMRQVNAYGGIVQPEAYAIHQDRVKRRAADIDPNIRVRLERGGAVSAADYIDMLFARERLVRAMDRRLSGLDVLIMPTAGIVAPKIADVADAEIFAKSNTMLLRNTSVGNFFDLCGISLPLPAKLPVGLMLLSRNGTDQMLLRIAAAVEALFASA